MVQKIDVIKTRRGVEECSFRSVFTSFNCYGHKIIYMYVVNLERVIYPD